MAPVTSPSGHPAPGRLTSLDAFRGLAIAGMILVNNPGSWSHVYAPLRHAVWHGATPTDLVFPFFLFGIGVAMSFSFAARTARGDSSRRLWGHVAKRALILYGLGLFMAAYPGFDFTTVRLVGVLARIAMVYLVAGTLVLFLSRRGRIHGNARLPGGLLGPAGLGARPRFRRRRPLSGRQPGRLPRPHHPRRAHVERRRRRLRPRGAAEHAARGVEHPGRALCGRLPADAGPGRDPGRQHRPHRHAPPGGARRRASFSPDTPGTWYSPSTSRSGPARTWPTPPAGRC